MQVKGQSSYREPIHLSTVSRRTSRLGWNLDSYSNKPEGSGLSEARQRVRSWVLRLNRIGLGSYKWNGIGKLVRYNFYSERFDRYYRGGGPSFESFLWPW